MAKEDRRVAKGATPPPDRHPRGLPAGATFGCVDWFQYDDDALAPVARSAAAEEPRTAQDQRDRTPSDERRLMGYVH